MDKSLEQFIRLALKEARETGQDYLTQTQLAVRAAREARPDIPASDALAAVNWIRRT